MTHTSTEPTIINPSNLLANIPGILGFHPQESMVFFLFEQDLPPSDFVDYPPFFVLGPVLRCDVKNSQQRKTVLRTIKDLQPELVFAAIISSELGEKQAAKEAARTARQAERYGVPIECTWYVSELFTGSPYSVVHGETGANLGPLTSGIEEWAAGKVGNILGSLSMQEMLDNGDLPAATRDESLAFLSADNPFMMPSDVASLTNLAINFGHSAVQAITEGDAEERDYVFTALMSQWQELCTTVMDQDLYPGDLMANEDLLSVAAVYFANIRIRDCILDSAFGPEARAMFRISVAIARSTTGIVRSNALCGVALSAPHIGASYRSGQAIQLAEEHDCRHGLTVLLREAQLAGGVELMTQACSAGSRLARENLLGT
ncbi:DUF4192 domain-containing protein [Staphylococcus chromogenes]|nr:DUF4192 domain-containing protein [Staphylococcus chromogenes]